MATEFDSWFDLTNERAEQNRTSAAGPSGSLSLTDEMLRTWPSGDLFGLTQNAGMGWDPQRMAGPQFLLLSTLGGLRSDDGQPLALGYHTGHWKLDCKSKQLRKSSRRLAVFRLPLIAATLATAGHKAPSACSTRYRIAMTQPL